MLLLCWVVAALPTEVWASLYWCTDASGARILTDTPAQLQSCTAIQSSAPAESAPSNTHSSSTPPSPEPIASIGATPVDPTSPTPAKPTSSLAIPLQRVGPLFVITIRINGENDGRLIVDTGASHTVLSRGLAIRSGLLTGAPNGVTMNTVGGQVQAEVVRVNSIRVGGMEVTDSVATIYDLPDAPPGIDGLLGLSFLGRFEVTLDAEKPQLLLTPVQK
ncbi:MAG: clan AA aspartic protease [Nitrospira sp.]|nr:clan AA aspartic protease [Nitrospira sp.]